MIVTIDRPELENILETLLTIPSPTGKEQKVAQYIKGFLADLGAEIYEDQHFIYDGLVSPTIVAKIPGDKDRRSLTLSSHTDVVSPNENLTIVKEGDLWKSDGSTTLGGDDKAGVATCLYVAQRLIKDSLPHGDLYLIFTPGEEGGMLGAKVIDWASLRKVMNPASEMIVLDNAGPSNRIAYQAPTCSLFQCQVFGKKAHAGIEPEKGINAIVKGARVLQTLPMGRISESVTCNVSTISSDFPANVVPDVCSFTGEVRGRTEAEVQEVLWNIRQVLEEVSPDDYTMNSHIQYPPLLETDGGILREKFQKVYEDLGVKATSEIIGGGSDANFFAKEGFSAIIIGVGMEKVHTTEETLDLREMEMAAKAVLHYITA